MDRTLMETLLKGRDAICISETKDATDFELISNLHTTVKVYQDSLVVELDSKERRTIQLDKIKRVHVIDVHICFGIPRVQRSLTIEYEIMSSGKPIIKDICLMHGIYLINGDTYEYCGY